MNTKVIGISIATFIGITVLATALMPILDDATTTTDTFKNDGYLARMLSIDEDTDGYTFEWDHANPTVATINGKTVDLFVGSLVSSADTFLARFGQDPTGYFIQWVPSNGLATVSYSAGTGTADLKIEISEGTTTITRTPAGSGVGDQTVNTVTISKGFAISPDGNYVMKSPDKKAYLNSDSQIYAMGLTTIAGVYNNGFYIDGTIESVTVEQYNPNPATYTISNVAINYTEDSDHNDLYLFDSVTFTATQIADSSVTANCTYNYLVVPYEVSAERTVHFTDGQNAILGAIPIMIIVAILLGVVALVIRSRME